MNLYSLKEINKDKIQRVDEAKLSEISGYVLTDSVVRDSQRLSNIDFIYYGDTSKKFSLEEMSFYSHFFSDETRLEEIINSLEQRSSASLFQEKSNKIIFKDERSVFLNKKKSITDMESEVQVQKSHLKEVKSLKQYVIRLLEVKAVEDLILETERLRFLREKSVKVSLIHTTESYDTLYSRAGAKKVESSKIKKLFSKSKSNGSEDLRLELANFLQRPTLKFSELSHEVTEEGDFYAIFEFQERIDKDDYFFSMLKKLLFTNFIRVVQSDALLRDTNLISQSFKQINAKAALITKDYKIRYSSDLEGLDKTCFKHLFNRTAPCEGCPLKKEESGFFELSEVDHTVSSSFVSTPRQKFSFHVYETLDEGRRRESIKAQRGKLKSLGVVTQSLTHELNNPLGGIFELSKELALQKDGQLQEDFEEVSKAALRCLEIISNLQSFASKKIKFSRINFAQTINKAMTFTKVLGREINKRTDLNEDIWISGSDTLLQQVIFNLFKNSVEAMGGRGDINIKLYKERESAVFEIQDSGPGFPEGMSSIELFGTLKKKEGTGLGLFLVKEFVNLHQADLDFGNLPEGGSYFKLIFHKLD